MTDKSKADKLLAEAEKADREWYEAAGEMDEVENTTDHHPDEDLVERCHQACVDTATHAMALLDHIRTTGEVPTGWARVALSDDARAVVAGLVASSEDVNRAGIQAPEHVGEAIRAAFPLSAFREWAARHDINDHEGIGYDPNAGE